MKLDLNVIKKQIDYYHLKLSEILTGFDTELEKQKKQIGKIRSLEIEILKMMERLDTIEKRIENLSNKDGN